MSGLALESYKVMAEISRFGLEWKISVGDSHEIDDCKAQERWTHEKWSILQSLVILGLKKGFRFGQLFLI